MKRALFLLLFAGSVSATAQDFLSWQLNDRYFTAQACGGFVQYRGDLKHDAKFQTAFSNWSLGMEARLLSKVAARAELGLMGIKAQDSDAPDSSFAAQRNLSFESLNWEFSLQGVFFMKPYKKNYHKRWQMDPYLLAGIGATWMSPTTTLDSTKYRLYQYETEGRSYSRLAVVVPVGAGIKFRINPFLNLITEFSYRFAFTDYLDDVSGDFPESYPDEITSRLSNRKSEVGVINPDAYAQLVPGAPRGNDARFDGYWLLNLKMEWYLPPGLFKK